MQSLVQTYDGYLRRQARRPIEERVGNSRRINGAWAAILILPAVGIQAGGTPWLALPFAILCIVGIGWSIVRLNKHGAEFDRTPPAAPWLETNAGKALIQAIGRVTMNLLNKVTLETKLRDDLKLSERDLFELFKILRSQSDVDEALVERAMSGGLTVGELLSEFEASFNDHPRSAT